MAEIVSFRHCHRLSLTSIPRRVTMAFLLAMAMAIAMAPVPGGCMVAKGPRNESASSPEVIKPAKVEKRGEGNSREPRKIDPSASVFLGPKNGVLGGGKLLGSFDASTKLSRVGQIANELNGSHSASGPIISEVKRASDPMDTLVSEHVSASEWQAARLRPLATYFKSNASGDMIPTETADAKHPEGDMTNMPPNAAGRAALFDREMRWPLNTVFYAITGPGFTDEERTNIIKAMDVLQEFTCIRFVGRPIGREDYIDFVKKSGCYSSVGRQKTRQELSLGPGCLTAGPGIAMHEIMHALGFFHEQSRPDRDNFVTIVWDNILSSTRSNFDKYPVDYVDTQGIPYDYGSIMHYGRNAFINSAKAGAGGATILPRNSTAVIGQRVALSDNDVRRIRKYYECDGTASAGTRPEVCSNNHETCPAWAAAGECEKNPAWMLKNCQDSCGICIAKGGCINEDTKCPPWAAMGECDKNPAWMLRSCRLACKNCNPMWPATGRSCQDSNTNCSFWARHGECTKNPAYMMQMCKRSCNSCV